jgi:hypothetical protein
MPQDTCVICMENKPFNTAYTCTTDNCDSLYCQACVNTWVAKALPKQTCALCRVSVLLQPVVPAEQYTITIIAHPISLSNNETIETTTQLSRRLPPVALFALLQLSVHMYTIQIVIASLGQTHAKIQLVLYSVLSSAHFALSWFFLQHPNTANVHAVSMFKITSTSLYILRCEVIWCNLVQIKCCMFARVCWNLMTIACGVTDIILVKDSS